MARLLGVEADRRAINITINSFGTELTRDERVKLFPAFGADLLCHGIVLCLKGRSLSWGRAAVLIFAMHPFLRHIFACTFSYAPMHVL
jgi:V-type H+-transporting ATPase subunit d